MIKKVIKGNYILSKKKKKLSFCLILKIRGYKIR